jgi:DNA modification methylase
MTSIKDLKADHRNARKRTDRSASLIAESLKRFGAARSIVIDEDNRILAGNGTVEGAKAAGIQNIRVIETDGTEIIAVKRTGLSEDDKIGLALADNRTSDLSDWDKDMLQQLSAEHDLAPWFEADDLAEIIGEAEQLPTEGLTDADDVPEAPEEPITKPGDVWLLGNHRVMCGDSTDVLAVGRLMSGKKADMVFTDPPYGVAYTGNSNPNTQNAHNSGKAMEIKNDKLQGEELKQLFQMSMTNAMCVTTKKAVFYIWYATSKSIETLTGVRDSGLDVRAYIFWYKVKSPMSAFMSQYIPNYEPLLYCYKTGSSTDWYGPTNEKCVWEQQVQTRDRVHPTQKPVELPERAINNSSKKGQLILDLFGGSGSTLIACEKTNRHARLMELDPKYCDVIVKRWEQFTGNKAMLELISEAF